MAVRVTVTMIRWLPVCSKDISKSWKRILTNLLREINSLPRTNRFDFGEGSAYFVDSKSRSKFIYRCEIGIPVCLAVSLYAGYLKKLGIGHDITFREYWLHGKDQSMLFWGKSRSFVSKAISKVYSPLRDMHLCISVCLVFCSISQKVRNWFWWNFEKALITYQGQTDSNLGKNWSFLWTQSHINRFISNGRYPSLDVCLFVGCLKILWTDSDEPFNGDWWFPNDQPSRVWRTSESSYRFRDILMGWILY